MLTRSRVVVRATVFTLQQTFFSGGSVNRDDAIQHIERSRDIMGNYGTKLTTKRLLDSLECERIDEVCDHGSTKRIKNG